MNTFINTGIAKRRAAEVRTPRVGRESAKGAGKLVAYPTYRSQRNKWRASNKLSTAYATKRAARSQRRQSRLLAAEKAKQKAA